MLVLTKIASEKVSQTVREIGDTIAYPRSTTPEGKWKTAPIRDWTSGFFPGILWYMNELTGDSSFRRSAERWTDGLAPLQFYTGSHDIGFMVNCSFGNGYRLTKNEEYRKTILQTAQTLLTRYNPNVGCIKSWDNRKWPYPVIIDNMMNLELLFWASQNGGTQQMHDAAVSHAEKTMQNHFRDDGSTYHVVGYDAENGNVLCKGTHQGYADASCWSRGQAWAIYGFAMSYRFTHDARFLRTAERAADYFIAHLPADNVPYWDFQAPKIPNEPRDASAGAIATSALLELGGFVNDPIKREKYYASAVSMLESLSRQPYFSDQIASSGILSHAVGNRPAGSEINGSLIYGDYYFIEALLRYKQISSDYAVQNLKSWRATTK
ncbi:MAG: glycoside hydrolase family 88 protein [Ignavibacteriales bacterium]|nr:glycoside hydrolase family 88 protein [Ignavibacteriales bacterium]